MRNLQRVNWLALGIIFTGSSIASTDCSTCTSEEGANNPIVINNVLNYGYSALIGSAILNAGTTIDDIFNPSDSSGYITPSYNFGNASISWQYYNSCPSIYYNSGKADCQCNGAETPTVSATGLLYFGNQGYSGSAGVDGGSWNPTNLISSLTTSPTSSTTYNINYNQALNPTAQIWQSAAAINMYPGDVLFTLFGSPIGTSGISPTNVYATNQVYYNFWYSTGSKNYSGNTGSCTSADNGYSKHSFDIISDTYGQYVDQFNLVGSPNYQFTFNTQTSDNPAYTVSSGNISVVTSCSDSSSCQTLYSDNGGSSPNINEAFVPDLTSGVDAASAPGGEAAVNINTNLWSGSLTETYSVSATLSQTLTQTTQQGVTNTDSSTESANISATLSETDKLTATDAVTTDEDTLSASFTAGFQESYTDTEAVNYSTTQTNTSTQTSTVSMSMTLTLPSPTATTGTYTVPGNSNSGVSSENNNTTSGTFDTGSCYLLSLTQNEGGSYLDSSYSIELSSTNYGVLPVLTNGTALDITNTPINLLSNAANTFNWWNTTKYSAQLGSGDSSSLVVNSAGNLTVLGSAQLQSGVNSDLTVNFTEQPCSTSTSSQAFSQSNSENVTAAGVNSSARKQPPFPWIASNELVDSRFNGYPNGIGYTPRHGHGFSIDLRDSSKSVDYVGSQSRDIVHLGPGDDTVVVGDGSDLVYAGGGRDRVSGGKGRNSLFGEDGDDLLIAGLDDDSLIGGPGDDQLVGGGGVDRYTPGPGNDSLYLDYQATSQIVGLSLKDKIYLGKFRVSKNGYKVSRIVDKSRNYILTPSYSIGFARLTERSTGKVIGMIKSWGNLYSARPAVWSDIALINASTLPSVLYKGVGVSAGDLTKLAESAKQWHFQEGFKKGSSVYKYADWNELRASPKNLGAWIKTISRKLTGKPVREKDLPRLIAGAQSQASAAGFVIGYF